MKTILIPLIVILISLVIIIIIISRINLNKKLKE